MIGIPSSPSQQSNSTLLQPCKRTYNAIEQCEHVETIDSYHQSIDKHCRANESPVIQKKSWNEQSLKCKHSPQKLQSPANCIYAESEESERK